MANLKLLDDWNIHEKKLNEYWVLTRFLWVFHRFLHFSLTRLVEHQATGNRIPYLNGNEVKVPLNLKITTLPETNIAPGNRPLQEESSIPTIHF